MSPLQMSLGEMVQDAGGVRVLQSYNLFMSEQGTLEISLSLFIFSLIDVQLSHLFQEFDGVEVFKPCCLRVDGLCLLIELLSSHIVALIHADMPQRNQERGCLRVFWPKGVLRSGQCTLK